MHKLHVKVFCKGCNIEIYIYILSLQLAKLCFDHTKETAAATSEELNPRVFALLSSVAENCRKEEIQRAINAAFRDLAEIEAAADRDQRQKEENEKEGDNREGQMDTEGTVLVQWVKLIIVPFMDRCKTKPRGTRYSRSREERVEEQDREEW